MKRTLSTLVRWVLVVGYASLILVLSLQPSLPGHGRIPDKLGHALEYMVLAFFLARALQKPGSRFRLKDLAITWIFCSGFAAFDEFVQSKVPGRHASTGDWLADISGITLLILLLLWRSYRERVLPCHETT